MSLLDSALWMRLVQDAAPLLPQPGYLPVLRQAGWALVLAALLQVFLDTVIDPVALQGGRWFLGQIYGYREVGSHYGVPLSNYFGWLLVSIRLPFS